MISFLSICSEGKRQVFPPRGSEKKFSFALLFVYPREREENTRETRLHHQLNKRERERESRCPIASKGQLREEFLRRRRLRSS